MDAGTWKIVKNLFEQLHGMPKENWDNFLLENCHDEKILTEVRSLVEADKQSAKSDFPSEIIKKIQLAVVEDEPLNLTGKVFGRYTLGRRVGSGGMGSVYSACSLESEFNQNVAIKLLHQHLWSKEQRDRFINPVVILKAIPIRQRQAQQILLAQVGRVHSANRERQLQLRL